eukprot:jgi/Pico_ML_1/50981/g180.t1
MHVCLWPWMQDASLQDSPSIDAHVLASFDRNDGRAHEHVDGANASVSEASEEEEERTAWSHAEEKIVKLGEHLDEATVRFEDSGVWLKFIAVFLPFWTAAVYYELYVADRASP